MSAIAGIYHLNNEPINLEHGNRMMKELEKYPADDIQTWHNDKVFLGCHAQWITPESLGEKLPYYDHERKLAITADAIIDNREELFERLQVDKSKRKEITDSELIVLSYHKWGEDSPKYLIGDFAFMIWDEREQKLFGARDFSGARTLYFYKNKHKFAFCTVMEPFFVLPYLDQSINEDWIAEYLASINMIETIAPYSTVYSMINQIPPAHTLLIKNGKIKFSRYVNLDEVEKLSLKNESDYLEAFRDIFQVAVNSRLRTFRKVGAHLSGGLDSGSVVSFAANSLKTNGKVLNTFSFVPQKSFVDWTPKNRFADESPYIRTTVDFVGNISDMYLNFDGCTPVTEINNLITALEMPYKFFENSIWIKGIYEKASESDIGILLEGSRGNYSISWGPALEYQALLLRKFRVLKFLNELSCFSRNIGISRSKILPLLKGYALDFHKKEFSYINPSYTNTELLERTNIIEKINEYEHIYNPFRGLLEGRKVHFNQLMSWTIDGVVNTKLSLRYSLWKRDPTNDLRVIRYCLSVPTEQYVQNGMDRALIRRALKGYLPDEIRLNQRTRGIQGVDVIHRMSGTWGDFTRELNNLSTDPIITNYINVSKIKEAITRVKKIPDESFVYNPEFGILGKSLILYRFLKKKSERR
ncbi:asparagine synthase-related protein [Neobacillus rhizosphaerae]|uniref:asparagine synthase-related protein n=1 Tax=Neobacillus rhizosphaerae TaxID=2880965 RepID=UPI003D2A209F